MRKQVIINSISVAIFKREYKDLVNKERRLINKIVFKEMMPEGLKMYLQTKAAELILDEFENEKSSTIWRKYG